MGHLCHEYDRSKPMVRAVSVKAPAAASAWLALVLSLLVSWNVASSEAAPARFYIDFPRVEVWEQTELEVAGWIWADPSDPIETVRLESGQWSSVLQLGLERTDVAIALRDPEASRSGFYTQIDIPENAVVNDEIALVAYHESGKSLELTRIAYHPVRLSQRWRSWLLKYPQWLEDPFWFVPGTSGAAAGDEQGFMKAYRDYDSGTFRVGLRVPVLYMRTTRGRANDWRFSANPEAIKLENGRWVADDWLQGLIDLSRTHQLPILFTLNGGVWGDAYSAGPEHDLIDHLELDPMNCQWDQNDRVYPDGTTKNLPGSMPSPELSRMLTLNSLNQTVRDYKKRNLQDAGRVLAAFAVDNPELFVGINLDADLYLSPFVKGSWHDFNPQTLEQFRQWLTGTGLYAPGQLLSEYREQNLSLEAINLLSGKQFASLQEVDPPREVPIRFLPVLGEDPWMKVWERFRRHLVALHYDDLSRWLVAVGISPDKIFSSQAFIESRNWVQPFAERLDSPVKNFDSAGVSVEGGKPVSGHLGVILYGATATNSVPTESGRHLFQVFHDTDPDWGIVEHSTADFRDPPKQIPAYAEGYRSLRDAFNYHARLLSPMAWNGNNGNSVDESWFHAHTAFRDTPMEDALQDFLSEYAYLPRKALYWGFGNRAHSDTDGWVANPERAISWSEKGRLRWHHPEGPVAITSADGLAIDTAIHRTMVIGTGPVVRAKTLSVQYLEHRGDGAQWQTVLAPRAWEDFPSESEGIVIPLEWPVGSRPEQLRLLFEMREQGASSLDHIVILPTGLEASAMVSGASDR